MIRDFKEGDQHRLIPNQFSDISGFNFSDPSYQKFTVESVDAIKCIICWTEYEPKKFAIFFLMADVVETLWIFKIRKFLKEHTAKLSPKSCITYSEDHEQLEKWHEFFGFTKDASQVMVDGKAYNKWVITWE